MFSQSASRAVRSGGIAGGEIFLFTFTGSMLTLGRGIYVGLKTHTPGRTSPNGGHREMSLYAASYNLTLSQRYGSCWPLAAGFAVKCRLFPLAYWLPLAHTECAHRWQRHTWPGLLLSWGPTACCGWRYPSDLIDSHVAPGVPKVVWWLGVLCIIGGHYGAWWHGCRWTSKAGGVQLGCRTWDLRCWG